MRANDDKNSEQSVIYTVFLSGSRKISRLNDDIRARIQTIIDKNLKVVIGDANGADKAIQNYLAEAGYNDVVVFCAGDTCRNNVGGWQQRNVEVDKKLSGRDFYTQKDKVMAAEADYGFVLWDGKSAGSINNVLELLKGSKPSIVYFGPDKSFHAVKTPADAKGLMQMVDESDFRIMNDKIKFDVQIRYLIAKAQPSQPSLNV